MHSILARTLALLFLAATALHSQVPQVVSFPDAANPAPGTTRGLNGGPEAATDFRQHRMQLSASSQRSPHTAVGKGSERLARGGEATAIINDGVRSNPAIKNWTAVAFVGVPRADAESWPKELEHLKAS